MATLARTKRGSSHGCPLLRLVSLVVLMGVLSKAFVVPMGGKSRSHLLPLGAGGGEDDGAAAASLSQQLGLEDRFDRWRYLQKLLDEETDPQQSNQLLYNVLRGYLEYPRGAKFGDSAATGSPERFATRLEKIEQVLSLCSEDAIPLSSVPQRDVSDLVRSLEELLPDPVEEEDDNKGTWDTIIELHGREAVKYSQRNPTLEWQARCLTARLLVFYDFLHLGIVDIPLDRTTTTDVSP